MRSLPLLSGVDTFRVGMPSEEAVGPSQILKYQAYGATIVEVAKERERLFALREGMPGAALAEIVTKQYSKRTEEMIEGMRANAMYRAYPNLRPEPRTELEILVANQPKSSAQVIGNHKIPVVTEAPTHRSRAQTEIEKMRSVLPCCESGTVGFHHKFDEARARDVHDAESLVSRLHVKQVASDEKLAAALRQLQSHVQGKARSHTVSGAQRGIRTK